MSVLQTENDIDPTVLTWSLTDLEYPNVKYDQHGVPYIRLNITEGRAYTPCIAGEDAKHERSNGDIVGSLFMPVGMATYGSKRGTQIAEDFKNLLSQQRFGNTITFAGRVVDAGLSNDEAWYRYNIIVRYQTNIIKP